MIVPNSYAQLASDVVAVMDTLQIPHAEFVYLPEVSHFAPLQRPDLFNQTMLAFLEKLDTV